MNEINANCSKCGVWTKVAHFDSYGPSGIVCSVCKAIATK